MVDSLIEVNNISKKFCKKLKYSLWYGVQDLTNELLARNNRRNGQLRKHEFWALSDISFVLKRGECIGLIGRNGAGKTTLLRMLNGLIKPNSGTIALKGRVGALIALGAGFNPILTGRENIYINGAVLGLTKREIDKKLQHIIDYAELQDFIDTPVQNYSSGMQVRLGFAVASSLQPDILLLDEVLAVGDIAFRAKCFNTLSAIRDRGAGFILVSHNMHIINRYADRVIYLKKGRIVKIGKPEEVISVYTKDMGESNIESEEETNFETVYGSGKLIIRSVGFKNVHGEDVVEINADQSVNLRISYECLAHELIDPLIDILIRDTDGIFFQATNVTFRKNFGAIPREGVFNVKFDTLPANNQRLLFYITILNKDTKEVYDWKRNIPLQVNGIPGSHGRVKINCHWEVFLKTVIGF